MSSDSEGPEEIPSWKGVSGTIILISIYDPINLGTPAKSYKAVCELIRNYMRTNNSQQLGICLFGLNDSNHSPQGIEGVFQIFPLTLPTLDDFKTLRSTNLTSFEQAKEFKLSDALWHCNKMFANCKKLLSTKTVIMLTRLDIPPVEADQKPTLKRVGDLVDSGIQIKIINVSEHSYHIDKFYENFLTEAHKGNDHKLPEPVWDESNLTKLMYHHSHRHIAVARLCLEIGEGFSIGVGVYGLLQSQTKPKKVLAHRETNQIVTSVITKYKVSCNNEDSDNEEAMDVDEMQNAPKVPLLKSELLYYQMFGDERIEVTDEERNKLKNPFGLPMMKLLGFKPASLLSKEKWFLKRCHFLYPSESIIEGSTIAFKALHQACTQMSVVAICVICSRVNAKPSIVALSPCTKPLDQDIKIGFDVIYIPFVENIRNVPGNEVSDKEIQEVHKMVFQDIITDLTFSYKSGMFENPSLQSLYNAIEALALDKTEVETFKDTTKPDATKLENIDAELFEEMFGPFGATAAKRPASNKTNGAEEKRVRVENIDWSLFETRLSRRQVDKYTVAELKQILKAKKVPNLPALTGLKKNELIELVYKD